MLSQQNLLSTPEDACCGEVVQDGAEDADHAECLDSTQPPAVQQQGPALIEMIFITISTQFIGIGIHFKLQRCILLNVYTQFYR